MNVTTPSKKGNSNILNSTHNVFAFSEISYFYRWYTIKIHLKDFTLENTVVVSFCGKTLWVIVCLDPHSLRYVHFCSMQEKCIARIHVVVILNFLKDCIMGALFFILLVWLTVSVSPQLHACWMSLLLSISLQYLPMYTFISFSIISSYVNKCMLLHFHLLFFCVFSYQRSSVVFSAKSSYVSTFCRFFLLNVIPHQFASITFSAMSSIKFCFDLLCRILPHHFLSCPSLRSPQMFPEMRSCF